MLLALGDKLTYVGSINIEVCYILLYIPKRAFHLFNLYLNRDENQNINLYDPC